ncbi:hypothetical protein [Pararhodobacter sp.]|uniref:hypothetical protein n=1 Tax=Pararhodobacter sp. TaxID=2127056 RepID=UPI002FDE7F8B
MPSPIRLETFLKAEEPPAPAQQASEALEEIKLDAYERGYVAGWEDSERQAEREALETRARVERQLEALSFTYHDARGHVLRAMEPVLHAMLETVVPEAARAAVIPGVIAQLLPLAQSLSEAPVTLRIAQGARPGFDAALAGLVLPPLEIEESADLGPGQAEIAFDHKETRVDLAQAAEELRGAISRFYQIQFEESRHA